MPFTVFPIAEDAQHGRVSVWNELRAGIMERGSPIFLATKSAGDIRGGNDGGDLREAILQLVAGAFPSFDGSVWIDTNAHSDGDISGYVHSAASPNYDSAYFWTFNNLLTAAGLFPATGVGPSPASRVNARYWNESYQAIRRLKSKYTNSASGTDTGPFPGPGTTWPVYLLNGAFTAGATVKAYKKTFHFDGVTTTSTNILSLIGSVVATGSTQLIGTVNITVPTPSPPYDYDQCVAVSQNFSFGYV